MNKKVKRTSVPISSRGRRNAPSDDIVEDIDSLKLTQEELNPSPRPEKVKETNKKQENKNKKKKKKKKGKVRKFFKWFFRISLILVLLMAIIITIIFYKPAKKLFAESNKIVEGIKTEDFVLASNLHIFDKDGNEMFTINQEKNIEYLSMDSIPQYVKDCFIATEDKRFYTHKGVDLKSLGRAGVELIRNRGSITQGGSTVTQQLVKLTYLTTEQSFTRKFKEMIIAYNLEKLYTKDQILEFYINNVYFGNNAYGINAAGIEYFGKSAKELTLAQIAYLCAIPNNPTVFDPYTMSKNDKGEELTYNKNTKERQELMLNNMQIQGMISQEECDKAKQEEIKLSHNSETNTGFDTRKNFIIKEAVEIQMRENGFNFKYKFNSDDERKTYQENYTDVYKSTLNKFFRSGYRIYTSFDEALQDRVQAEIDERFSSDTETTSEGIYAHQVASITLENSTGLIKTMIGGRTSDKTDYLNRAYAVQRQNGSTMKPIAVYAPAFDLLGFTPSTVKKDEKEDDGPKNSDGVYYGDVTLREALRLSLNTVAYKLYREVTPYRGLSYIQNMEFESILPNDVNLASGLGGLSLGTNVKEVAGAYAALANNGQFNRPSCIVRMENSEGKTVYEHTVTNTQIYKKSTAQMMINVLETAATQGTGAGSQFNQSIAVAGKTGTTDDNKDLWFAGCTPLYTTVVWSGYDTPRDIEYSTTMQPNRVWSAIMNIMHEGMVDLDFKTDDSVKFAWVDSQGYKVPQGTPGARYEIFPSDYQLQDNINIINENTRNAMVEKIESLYNNAINSNSKEMINNAINDLKVVSLDCSNSSLANDVKTQIISVINLNIKKLEEKLNSLNGSTTNIKVTPNETTITKEDNTGGSFEVNTNK